MIDTGAEGYAFIDTSFAQHHLFPLCPVTKLKTLHRISGHQDGHLGNHVLAAELQVGNIHKEFNAWLFATKIGTYPVILSMPWV
jgi:hypothetical protein